MGKSVQDFISTSNAGHCIKTTTLCDMIFYQTYLKMDRYTINAKITCTMRSGAAKVTQLGTKNLISNAGCAVIQCGKQVGNRFMCSHCIRID